MWNFDRYGENIALKDDIGCSVTYKNLSAESNRFSESIGKRCLIFILCKNTIGSVLGYVTCLNNNIVPVLLSAQMDKGLLKNLMDTYCPSYIWSPEEISDFENTEIIYNRYSYNLIKTSYKNEYPLNDKLALLLTTSGSTGSPKFVRQSYENIEANTNSIIEYLRLNADERPITTLPMNYTYGLSIINTHLMVGAMVLLTEKSIMQREFWTFFEKAQATSFGGVPYTYEILKKLKMLKKKLPSLRTMTQAGGKLTPELHEDFAKYAAENGLNFVVMYGQCEATARMGYLPENKAIEKKGSMGIAIPGGNLRLFDVNDEEIKNPYETGELIYSGKNVTLGYAECGEDLIKGDERHGILKTGDMAQFDEDGYFYIVGRKKRFLKIYGNRVNLDEIERMIKGHFNDIEVACSGLDDHMYIFTTESDKTGKIKEFASEITKLNPAAFITVVIDKIPQNDAGKIMYKELEKYYQ